ncbi:uncharacterized protein LOC109518145 [Hippocampus comes]|uniref:uncharacterized protein LOC109518145 n=1 Tax=Hippocampus comes TaxID=109280 RepID=UPI00094E92AF|nr:PREDICTED: uncharacterized protein LOC109518145 [Hippocampus comes]
MNREIVALRDSKLRLLSKLRAEAKQFQRVRGLLPSHLQRLPPPLPTIRPEEIQDKIPCTRRILEKYRLLRDQRFQRTEREDQEEGRDLLEPLENEVGETEGVGDAALLFAAIEEGEEEEPEGEEAAELSEQKESKLLSMQDSILEKMESMVTQFDKEHLTCLQKAQMLDWRLKLGHLRQLTLYQELLLLEEVDKREEILQEKVDARVKEENNLMAWSQSYLSTYCSFVNVDWTWRNC